MANTLDLHRDVAVGLIDWLDGLRSITLFLLMLMFEATIVHQATTWWLLTRSNLDEIKRAILSEATCVSKREDAEICSVLFNNANL